MSCTTNPFWSSEVADRFICLIGAAVENGQSARPRRPLPADFELVLDERGVEIHSNAPLNRLGGAAEGWKILGHAWRRDGIPASNAGPAPPSADDVLARYWGIFLGIGLAPDGDVTILRDPSGQFPCYYQRYGAGWAVGSDIALLRQCLPAPIEIDWTQVGDAMLFVNHFSRQTALVGVMELLPGEALMLGPQGLQTRMIWAPSTYAAQLIDDPREAVERLSEAFAVVHSTLMTAYPRPLVTISGGLDSSIVATEASLHADSLNLLTFYTRDDPLGDERAYARIVASACHAKLAEAEYREPDFSTCARADMILPRPTFRNVAGLVNARILDHAFLNGNSAVLGGFGGDNIFFVSAPGYAIRDRLHHGAGSGDLLRTMRDLKGVASASPYALAEHAAREIIGQFRTKAPYRWPSEASFLAPDVTIRTAPAASHPWLATPENIRPGAAAHIASLIRAQTYLERFPRSQSVANLFPLLLAPIVETCLAIPSWLWCNSGMDRSIARLAARNLPPEIVARSSKGSPVRMHARFFEAFANDIAVFLGEGLLAQRGIIDPDAVRAYCQRPPPVRDFDYLRLIELVDAEIWCRYWQQV